MPTAISFKQEIVPVMVFELFVPVADTDSGTTQRSYREVLENILSKLKDDEFADKFLEGSKCEIYLRMRDGERAEFRQRLNEICSGSTIIQAEGRFLSHTGQIIQEPSEVIRIIVQPPEWLGKLSEEHCTKVRILVHDVIINLFCNIVRREQEVWCMEYSPVTLHKHVRNETEIDVEADLDLQELANRQNANMDGYMEDHEDMLCEDDLERADR